MPIPLLTTKMHTPPLRRELVSRPRLIAQLNVVLLRVLASFLLYPAVWACYRLDRVDGAGWSESQMIPALHATARKPAETGSA